MEPIIISASFFQEQPSLGILGRTGEHEARRISFDCGEVLKTWPEATILCVCRRPCDTAAYPIPLTADGTTYTMPLTSRETAAAGAIKLELRAVRDATVLKSAIFYGRILPSLNGQKDAPGNPLSDALNRLESTIANAQTLADEIRQKLDNGEFIGERGPQGEPGKDGSDATVTAQNIESALGYAPVKDVQVAGSSVLVGDVANVPVAQTWVNGAIHLGVVAPSISHGLYVSDDLIKIYPAESANIAQRRLERPITPTNLDTAVKAAMCDGKGAAWTADEQKAARIRMGADGDYVLIEETVLAEETLQFSRSQEPDGTPYNLSALKVIVKFVPGQQSGAIFLYGYDSSSHRIMGAASDYISMPSASAPSEYRSTAVIDIKPIFGMYDCMTSQGSQGSAMKVTRAANGDFQVSSSEMKIANFLFHLYGSDGFEPIIAGTKISIYGVRA